MKKKKYLSCILIICMLFMPFSSVQARTEEDKDITLSPYFL